MNYHTSITFNISQFLFHLPLFILAFLKKFWNILKQIEDVILAVNISL